jgi:hypothetical protein
MFSFILSVGDTPSMFDFNVARLNNLTWKREKLSLKKVLLLDTSIVATVVHIDGKSDNLSLLLLYHFN